MDMDNPAVAVEEERYYICRHTRKGKALMAKQELAKWNGEKLEVPVTRVMAGGGYVDPDELVDLTDVINPIAEMELGPHSLIEGDDCAVRLLMRLSSASITKTALIRQLVVYVEDPDEGEIVYQVLQYHWDNPQPLSSLAANYGAVSIFENEMILIFADGEAVAIPQSPGWFLTQDDLAALNPNTYIATVEHHLGRYPACTVTKQDYALDVVGLDMGPLGASKMEEIPAKLVYDGLDTVEVYVPAAYAGCTTLIPGRENTWALIDEGSATSLLLILR